MARPLQFIERVLARFPEGTLARIRAVAGSPDGVAGFIREAVERELRRRERLSSKSCIRDRSTAAPSYPRQGGKR